MFSCRMQWHIKNAWCHFPSIYSHQVWWKSVHASLSYFVFKQTGRKKTIPCAGQTWRQSHPDWEIYKTDKSITCRNDGWSKWRTIFVLLHKAADAVECVLWSKVTNVFCERKKKETWRVTTFSESLQRGNKLSGDHCTHSQSAPDIIGVALSLSLSLSLSLYVTPTGWYQQERVSQWN